MSDSELIGSGEVPRGEKMLFSGTDPESYITEYAVVYEGPQPGTGVGKHSERATLVLEDFLAFWRSVYFWRLHLAIFGAKANGKARGLLYHLTLGLRVMKKKQKSCAAALNPKPETGVEKHSEMATLRNKSRQTFKYGHARLLLLMFHCS